MPNPTTTEAIIETNEQNVPDSGVEEGIPTGQAEVAAAETVENQTATVDSSENVILQDVAPEVAAEKKSEEPKAQPSGENTPVKIEDSVREHGVEEVLDTTANNLEQAAVENGGTVVGETVSPTHISGEAVVIPSPTQNPNVAILHPLEGASSKNPEQSRTWKFVTDRMVALKKQLLGGQTQAAPSQIAPTNVVSIEQGKEKAELKAA